MSPHHECRALVHETNSLLHRVRISQCNLCNSWCDSSIFQKLSNGLNCAFVCLFFRMGPMKYGSFLIQRHPHSRPAAFSDLCPMVNHEALYVAPMNVTRNRILKYLLENLVMFRHFWNNLASRLASSPRNVKPTI